MSAADHLQQRLFDPGPATPALGPPSPPPRDKTTFDTARTPEQWDETAAYLDDQGDQYPMLTPAKHLANPRMYAHQDQGGADTEKFQAMKLYQAKTQAASPPGGGVTAQPGEETVYQSIQRQGIRTPVALRNNTLIHGHHRVIAANDIDPNTEVPRLQVKGGWYADKGAQYYKDKT